MVRRAEDQGMLGVIRDRWLVVGGLLASSSLLIWGTAFGGRSFGPVRALLVALPYGDKVGHLGLYGSIALALGLLVRNRADVAGAGLAVILLGVGDEFRQLTEGNRNFSAGDILANLAGVSIGLLVAFAWRRMQGSTADQLESELYIL